MTLTTADTVGTCANRFDTSVTLTCTVRTNSAGETVIKVAGLFPNEDSSGYFGPDLGGFTNPTNTGYSGSFKIEVKNPDNYLVAEKTNSIPMESMTPVATSTCESPCATCANTTSYCTSCNSPATLPILFEGQCVDDCPSGYFLNGQKCYQCHGNCASCTNYKDTDCISCKENFLFEDGKC